MLPVLAARDRDENGDGDGSKKEVEGEGDVAGGLAVGGGNDEVLVDEAVFGIGGGAEVATNFSAGGSFGAVVGIDVGDVVVEEEALAGFASMQDFWAQVDEAAAITSRIGAMGSLEEEKEEEEEEEEEEEQLLAVDGKFENISHVAGAENTSREGAIVAVACQADMESFENISRANAAVACHTDIEKEQVELGGEDPIAKAISDGFEVAYVLAGPPAGFENGSHSAQMACGSGVDDPFCDDEEYITSSHWLYLAEEVAYSFLGSQSKCIDYDEMVSGCIEVSMAACVGFEDSMIYTNERLVWQLMKEALIAKRPASLENTSRGASAQGVDAATQTRRKERGKKLSS